MTTGDATFDSLLALMRQDAMVLREVVVPTHEVVFFKNILEAYPGVVALHARARRGVPKAQGQRLTLATTEGFVSELEGILRDLQEEIPVRCLQ